MNRYLVLDGERELYVAVERDDRFYVYDPHTEHFHASMPLWRDFFGDRELTYRPLDAAQARELVASGVGRYDGRLLSDLLTARRADPHPVSVDDLLGRADDAKAVAISPRRRAKVLAEQMAAHRGHWLTWRTYERSARAAASVQASELRTGKVAATRHLPGRVEAEAVPVGNQIEVRARII